MRKVLQVSHPIIRAYLRHAFATSILGRKIIENGWLYQKYIALEYHKLSNEKYLTYKNYDFFMNEGAFIKHFALAPSDRSIVIDFIKSYINDECYFFSYWNEKFIQGKEAYGKYDFSHACLFYGYDDDKKVFYTEGYLTENWKWSVHCVSYKEVEKAMLLEVDKGYFWCDAYQCCDRFRCLFSYSDMIKEFDEYFFQKPVKKELFFGIDACENFLSELADEFGTRELIKRTPFYCLVEHREFMEKRLSFLVNNNLLENALKMSYKKYVNEYKQIQMQVLKYNLTRNITLGCKIFARIEELIKADHELLFLVYKNLKKG